MKLAVMEGLYEGGNGVDLIAFAIPNPSKKEYNDNEDAYLFPPISIPKGLSWMSFGDPDSYVPGIKELIEGGYPMPNGETAISFTEKQAKGKAAFSALENYKAAKANNDTVTAASELTKLYANYNYFGYGYLDNHQEIIPNIQMVYWSFHIMVYLGGYFIAFFIAMIFFVYRKTLAKQKWFLWIAVISIPLPYIAGQAGWIVAEVGRQPWTIQDILPLKAAVSAVSSTSVMTTFFLFLILFTALLIAEVGIMLKQIKKGPEDHDPQDSDDLH